MDGDIKTTFVPRRPTLAAAPPPTAGRGPDFVSLVTTVLFVLSAVLAGGVWAWQLALGAQIRGQAKSLERAERLFNADLVEQASRLNDRIVAANEILDRHVAPSTLLDILERFTLRTVSFQSFTYAQGPDGKIALNAAGVGENFASIVLQSDEFGGPAQMRDVVFSKLEPNDQNFVGFDFSASIDPSAILYFRSLNAGGPSDVDDEEGDDEAVAPAPSAPSAATSSAAPARAGSAAPTIPAGSTSL